MRKGELKINQLELITIASKSMHIVESFEIKSCSHATITLAEHFRASQLPWLNHQSKSELLARCHGLRLFSSMQVSFLLTKVHVNSHCNWASTYINIASIEEARIWERISLHWYRRPLTHDLSNEKHTNILYNSWIEFITFIA